MKPYILLLFLALAGCGFHLKGLGDTTKHQAPLSVTLSFSDSGTNLLPILTEVLKQQNITVAVQAPYHLKIEQSFQEKIPFSMGQQNQGMGKEITLIDGFSVQFLKGETVLGTREISSQSVVRYRSNTYLGSSREEESIHQRLAQENGEKLIRFINAVRQ